MPEPIEVTTTYRDQASKDSTNTVFIADGLSIAQITEGLQGFAQLVDTVTTAVIRGVDFTISVDVSALTSNVASGSSDVEEVGEFISVTGANRPVQMNVPAIDTTLSPAGSDDMDQVNADVASVISMLEDGLATTGGTIIPCDIDENDIVAVSTSRERTRNSGTRS